MLESTSRHAFLSRELIEALVRPGQTHVAPSSTSSTSTSTSRTAQFGAHGHHDILSSPAMLTAARNSVVIKQIARTMGFPARTVCTAQYLTHRVYLGSAKATAFSPMDLALACLFVAAKMEETTKRLRDLLAHAYVVAACASNKPHAPSAAQVATSVTDRMKHGVLNAELFVLDAIAFDFRTRSPHMLFVKLAKRARAPMAVAATGWLILCDVYFTTVPVQYPYYVVAAGALCLAWNLHCADARLMNQLAATACCQRDAARATDEREPVENVPGAIVMDAEWWTALGVSSEDMRGFIQQTVDFYTLFFAGVGAEEAVQRYELGLPSRAVSQKIGQWRMRLNSASITPVSPSA